MKNKYFHQSDRFGRRQLIINGIDKKEFILYLKDILSQQINDSCVLYVDYSSTFFEDMILMVSPSELLGNVKYLTHVVNKINKDQNIVALIFGFHCPKNAIWIQSTIEKKTKIYNLFK